jgi:hypothetical protein
MQFGGYHMVAHRLGPIQVRTAGTEVYQSLRQAILDGWFRGNG